MTALEKWRGRGGTATAMSALCLARLVVAVVPFERWRDSLGFGAGRERDFSGDRDSETQARRWASFVERAAQRLPFATKCLPRAVALSWMLRRQGIGHALVFAVRPAEWRGSADRLHAWVEISDRKIIGNLPGPFVETLRLGR
ncbi:MAG: lasso peptide biosynthesis B2 protein [Sphingomicrobium sp.]